MTTDIQTIQIEGFPFKYPKNLEGCVRGVLEGEYAFPKLPDAPPIKRILDLGANVGAFAIWAHAQWPEAEILCYEPHPDAFKLLEENTDHLGSLVRLHNVAIVTDPQASHVKLYEGKDWGYNSVQENLNPKSGAVWNVPIFSAWNLPSADIMKVDIEGGEFGVFTAYRHLPFALLLEWHDPQDRDCFQRDFPETGYRMFRSEQLIDCMGRQMWCRSKATYDKESGKYVLPPEKESPPLAPSKAEGFGA